MSMWETPRRAPESNQGESFGRHPFKGRPKIAMPMDGDPSFDSFSSDNTKSMSYMPPSREDMDLENGDDRQSFAIRGK